MINIELKNYNFYTLGENNAYGQPKVSDMPAGSIVMAIYPINHSIGDNVIYHNATFMGLTRELINDKYIIEYRGNRLKVLYVQELGRFKQVYMAKM